MEFVAGNLGWFIVGLFALAAIAWTWWIIEQALQKRNSNAVREEREEREEREANESE